MVWRDRLLCSCLGRSWSQSEQPACGVTRDHPSLAVNGEATTQCGRLPDHGGIETWVPDLERSHRPHVRRLAHADNRLSDRGLASSSSGIVISAPA